jgi:hypothetical protein
MNIRKNLDANNTAKAAKSILWVIVSIGVFTSALFLFPPLKLFVFNHPGLIGVLIAVAGEVWLDWNLETGKHAALKRFFMALLVVSLAYELYEASETDKKAADAINLAGQANQRASSNEVQVAEANKHAAEANGRAVSNELQLVKAEAQLRKINGSIPFSFRDRAETIKILSKFAGIEAKIEYSNDDLDALASAQEIETVLKLAGWRTSKVPAQLFPDSIGVLVKGMRMGIDLPKTPQGVLESEIGKAGASLSVREVAPEENVSSDTVIIRIPPSWKDPFTVWDAANELRKLTNRPAQMAPQKN